MTAPLRFAKKTLRRTIGYYRLVEVSNKVRLGPASLAVRHFESSEVSRLARSLPRRPHALVATVIATYRRPESLSNAVESALAQTVTDQVVIVVDDGGGLPPLPHDERLFSVSLSRNTNVLGSVRNVGIRLSASDYVAFLDDDNEWETDHLECALAALRPGTDLVYTALRRQLPDGRLLDVHSVPFDRHILVEKGDVVDSNAIVARRRPGLHFSRLPRDPNLVPREDWEFVFRVSRRHRVQHVPVATVRYLVNPKSFYSSAKWKDDLGLLFEEHPNGT